MTSPVLFHLSWDGFQAQLFLCLLYCHLTGSKEKFAVKATPLPFPLATSQGRLEMRSDDTRAPVLNLRPNALFSVYTDALKPGKDY